MKYEKNRPHNGGEVVYLMKSKLPRSTKQYYVLALHFSFPALRLYSILKRLPFSKFHSDLDIAYDN